MFRLYGIAKRGEKPLQQCFTPTTGQHSQGCGERDRRLGQDRTIATRPRQRQTKDLGAGHAQERGGDIRAVVDILLLLYQTSVTASAR
jgi:hypothetical protein